jgi:hypothetical protein
MQFRIFPMLFGIRIAQKIDAKIGAADDGGY